MIKTLIYFGLLIIVLSLFTCKTEEKVSDYENIKDSFVIESGNELLLKFTKGKSFNHPSFAIWVEDMEGNYFKTLFLTGSYASGTFAYKMLGDTIWIPESGESYQPAALPYWTHKKGLINNLSLVPTLETPFVDAYTGSTPNGSFIFNTQKQPKPMYRILVEINQTWDWNKYWTNDKYPESKAYKHSAQPSIIYTTTVNDQDTTFYFNPIGHGDPEGETGKIFTDISTLTSAKNIFSNIKVINKK